MQYYKITGEYWQKVGGFNGDGRYGIDIDGWRYSIGWIDSADQLRTVADYKVATLRQALGHTVDWAWVHSAREGW